MEICQDIRKAKAVLREQIWENKCPRGKVKESCRLKKFPFAVSILRRREKALDKRLTWINHVEMRKVEMCRGRGRSTNDWLQIQWRVILVRSSVSKLLLGSHPRFRPDPLGVPLSAGVHDYGASRWGLTVMHLVGSVSTGKHRISRSWGRDGVLSHRKGSGLGITLSTV